MYNELGVYIHLAHTARPRITLGRKNENTVHFHPRNVMCFSVNAKGESLFRAGPDGLRVGGLGSFEIHRDDDQVKLIGKVQSEKRKRLSRWHF